MTEAERKPRPSTGLPPRPGGIQLAPPQRGRLDVLRIAFIAAGLVALAAAWLAPLLPAATDASGAAVPLTAAGQAALGLFALAALWWGFEVVPIGITGIAVGVLQVVLAIRAPKAALGDFLDPCVWLVLGSLVVGMAFARTGLTQRLAYRVLLLFGERTSLVYLGAFVATALLSVVMAHTAAAAAVFPVLMAIHLLYDDSRRPTRFGKGLFIGMAMTAGAGSTVTLLGSARAPVAIGFFEEITGRQVGFWELTRYALPLGWGLVLLFWLLMLVVYRPEKKAVPGMRDRLGMIEKRLGPPSAREWTTLAVVGATLVLLGVTPPAHKGAVVAAATVALFLFGVLKIEDLEAVPWNIVLLFGGATSLGLCLWQTGAARWLAALCRSALGNGHPTLVLLALALFALLVTNALVNVAVLSLLLPVGLAAAPSLGLAPEVVLYATLTAAGLPMLLLNGSAPNAMAYESRQFTSREFFRAGALGSLTAMGVLALCVLWLWPLLGMPVRG
jgi:sodium-dependent dicarboxylate transporter 2/3/5